MGWEEEHRWGKRKFLPKLLEDESVTRNPTNRPINNGQVYALHASWVYIFVSHLYQSFWQPFSQTHPWTTAKCPHKIPVAFVSACFATQWKGRVWMGERNRHTYAHCLLVFPSLWVELVWMAKNCIISVCVSREVGHAMALLDTIASYLTLLEVQQSTVTCI